MNVHGTEIPRGNASGFKRYFKQDFTSGFLVFLIALPLCLAIARASGFPAIAGIFTAITGALVTTFLSNSEMTIKGPAAGLIVIVMGCVTAFGGDGATGGFSPEDMAAYRATLAVGAAAAVLQILFGVFRGGILGEFFPITAVHGMLAAIGVIIILKQFPVALGVDAKGEPLELLKEVPDIIAHANWPIAAIGLVSLAVMFIWPLAGKRVGLFKRIPSPVIVLLIAIPMGMAFDLLDQKGHLQPFFGKSYEVSDKYLVAMPDKMFGMFEFITTPDFSALARPIAWKWILMFFLIGSLESLLSAKAIDLLDPWKRKTNLNRDMAAVGIANLGASMIGGLPMISEIVRSKANIMNGARTRFADFWHGLFLLACVALMPMYLHRIPLAALAAMLVYTGTRLAHPTEFINVYRIGREQLLIFVTTIVAVLATDLLIGIGVGILLKLVIHVMNGVSIKSLFKPYLEVEQQNGNTCIIRAHHSAVFSNWIPFRRQIEDLGLVQRQNIVIDLSKTKLVDHSVMEKLHELQADFEQENLHLTITGLESHRPAAGHELSAQVQGLTHMRRLTVVTDEAMEEMLEAEFLKRGATGYIATPCKATLRPSSGATPSAAPSVRIEVIVPLDVADELLTFLRTEVLSHHRITSCVETVSVIRRDQFMAIEEAAASHGH